MANFLVNGEEQQGTIRDQQQWSLQHCANVFASSLDILKTDLAKHGDGGILVWDKVGAVFSCVSCVLCVVTFLYYNM